MQGIVHRINDVEGVHMRVKSIIIIATAGLVLAGCSADSGPKDTLGALIGGVAGGLLGNTIGHGDGRAAATIFGAALGAIIGASVGRDLDERDREYAYFAADRKACAATGWNTGRTRKTATAASSARCGPMSATAKRAAISPTPSGWTASRSRSKGWGPPDGGLAAGKWSASGSNLNMVLAML